MNHHDTETRIFARLAAREPIFEIARVQSGGTHDAVINDALRTLPEKCGIWLTGRAVEPECICARSGHRRLRCDEGPVTQDFAALQASAAGEPEVMFL